MERTDLPPGRSSPVNLPGGRMRGHLSGWKASQLREGLAVAAQSPQCWGRNEGAELGRTWKQEGCI